jgi:predicted acyltransferase (DUF342 family)
MSSSAIAEAREKADEKTGKAEKSERLKELEKKLADLQEGDDEVEPEAVPSDTTAELERVKQLVGAHIGIDMRSPGQVKQAEIDGLKAEIELEQQQAKEAKEAEQAEKDAEREQKEAEEAEAKAKTGTARSAK